MNDNQKDEIGAIPSIDDDRATVDLQGQRGKKASKGYLKDILIFGGGNCSNPCGGRCFCLESFP